MVSWKIFLVLIFIIVVFFSSFYAIQNSKTNYKSINDNVFVVKRINSGIIVNYKMQNIYVKSYDNLSTDDLINLKSTNLEKNKGKTNFEKYLKSEGVNYIANNPTIKYLGTKKSLKRKIQDYFTSGPVYYSRYGPLILLGLRYYKNEVIISKIKNISILHLVTISGFHINLILLLIEKILRLFKIQNKYVYILIFLFLIPYILIMNIPIAATRALIFSFLCIFNKYFLKNKFHKLNLLSITMMIFFLINPYIIFSLSFIFTFILTYAIVLTTSLSNKNKKIKILLIASIFSILINLITNKEINFTSVIFSLFFSPIIAFVYILTFLFFWLKPIMDNCYLLLDILINISQHLKLSINLDLQTNWIIVIYSILFVSILIIGKKPILKFETKKYSKKEIIWWLNH